MDRRTHGGGRPVPPRTPLVWRTSTAALERRARAPGLLQGRRPGRPGWLPAPASSPEVAAPALSLALAQWPPQSTGAHTRVSVSWGPARPGSRQLQALPGVLSGGRGPLCLQPWGDSECSRGRERGAVCFLLSPGLALELSPPAYTRARTRPGCCSRDQGPAGPRGVPQQGGRGRPGTAAGALCLLWA